MVPHWLSDVVSPHLFLLASRCAFAHCASPILLCECYVLVHLFWRIANVFLHFLIVLYVFTAAACVCTLRSLRMDFHCSLMQGGARIDACAIDTSDRNRKIIVETQNIMVESDHINMKSDHITKQSPRVRQMSRNVQHPCVLS